MRDLLETTRRGVDSDAVLTWVSEEFLLEQEVAPWSELPVWLPKSDCGLMAANVEKAVAAGLTFRPLEDSACDTWKWDQTRSADAERRAGMKVDREAEVLAAWKNR